MAYSLTEQLVGRELGRQHVNESQIIQQRCARLRLSHTRTIQSAHAGGITWLCLDQAEQRYLLAAAADATIGVYDTQALDGSRRLGGGASEVEPLCFIGRQHPGSHQFLVSCVSWYPEDTGLFVSGAYDQYLKLWDTNSLEVVTKWQLPAKVSCCALSSIRGPADGLVAVASQDPALRLCDIRSGALTHTLVGHRHPVWSVSWSARDEHQLVSGDEHGQILVWDIRRFGPVQLLDMYCTQRPRPRAATAGSDGTDGDDSAAGQQDPFVAVASRAQSAPTTLESAVDSAWRVVDEHRRARPGIAALGSLTGKRTREGRRPPATPASPAASAGPALPGLQDLPCGRQAPVQRVLGHSRHGSIGLGDAQMQGGGGQGGGAGSGMGRHPAANQRVPLGSSAPIRPGRTGEVIGGRAPSPANRTNLHSGLSDAAVRAHQGSVTCVLPTPDGLFWLSGGTDSRLRLWDAVSWHRQLTGYTGTHNRALRARQLAVTQDGTVVFHPTGSIIQVFNVHTAASLCELSGHTESINACAWNPLSGELYSGANDCRILVWSPQPAARHAAREQEDDVMPDRDHDDAGHGNGEQAGGQHQAGGSHGRSRPSGAGSSGAADRMRMYTRQRPGK